MKKAVALVSLSLFFLIFSKNSFAQQTHVVVEENDSSANVDVNVSTDTSASTSTSNSEHVETTIKVSANGREQVITSDKNEDIEVKVVNGETSVTRSDNTSAVIKNNDKSAVVTTEEKSNKEEEINSQDLLIQNEQKEVEEEEDQSILQTILNVVISIFSF